MACGHFRESLDGVPIRSVIETGMSYSQWKNPEINISDFLLMTGYLRSAKMSHDERGYVCELAIPNKKRNVLYRPCLI